MNQAIAWAGFLGAWLLVAGPLYQGAIELREEDIGRDEIQATKTRVARPEPPSPWWWLLPPVMYAKRRQQSKKFRDDVLAQLTPVQREQFTRFMNKAAGWFTVAAGAALLAVDQTWQVIERYHWPGWLWWPLVTAMLVLSVVNTAVRMNRDEQVSGKAYELAEGAAASEPAG
jgi:hypothetical protein